jgi:hypothetical protein
MLVLAFLMLLFFHDKIYVPTWKENYTDAPVTYNNYASFRLDVFTCWWRWRNLPLRFQQTLKHAEGLHSLPILCSWICPVLLEFVKCSRSGLRLVCCTELMTMKIYANICRNFIRFFFYIKLTILIVYILPNLVEAISFRVIFSFS